MSSLSFAVRVLLLAVLLGVAFGQSSSSSSSSSSASSFSSSSSSSAAVAPSSSSSAGGVAPPRTLPTPVITVLTGCNNNATANVTDLNSCDGATGSSTITIQGANFTMTGTTWDSWYDSMTVNINCQSGGQYSAWFNRQSMNSGATRFTASTPQIDKSDVNSPCSLTITHNNTNPSLNYLQSSASNGMTIQFSSYSYDLVEFFNFLGMTLKNLIIAVTVIGIVIVVIVVLCTLSCCCGVSLAFLNCCRARTTTVVYSPSTGGYSSMA